MNLKPKRETCNEEYHTEWCNNFRAAIQLN